MRRRRALPLTSLFPFMSVLLCIMGVLAFIAVSLLLLNQSNLPEIETQFVEFQWVGAPAYVKPVFIRCFQEEIVYFDLFQGKDLRLSFEALVAEIQLRNGPLTRYLRRVVKENQDIKRAFGSTEHYPLLLIYPDGVISAEILMLLIEQIEGLNAGLEPMMPQWRMPYQSEG